MISIPDYFYDLFTSDATLGLDPYDEDFNFRSRMDGDDYVLIVSDSSEEEFCDPDLGLTLEDAPTYEIRVTRIK